MIKDFAGWHKLKASLNVRENAPSFQPREIWWCSIGVNIGHEEDRKNQFYNRPVLIIRKFNSHIFWWIPLTTQIKENLYYHKINFNDKEQCVMLTHMRPLESKRLTAKMGKLSSKQFLEIVGRVKNIIGEISSPANS